MSLLYLWFHIYQIETLFYIVTDTIKYNLMNLLKILTCFLFVWQCYDILVFKVAYNWPVKVIGDRLIARLLFW